MSASGVNKVAEEKIETYTGGASRSCMGNTCMQDHIGRTGRTHANQRSETIF